jgi:UDP-N-acetylmuramate--alanine ligase
VHIIGVGGTGMSAVATVLLAMGHRVTGSDAADSDRLQRLARAGAEVHVGHDPSWLGDADLVSVSTAIPPTNAEVAEAGRRGLRVWRRAELLAAICRQRRTVAVAGTHGKTTTSAMLAVILRDAGARPGYIVGGDLFGSDLETVSGAAWEPDGEWLVVEADESDGTFLELGADAVVVTSVEADHLDFYGDVSTMRAAFERFAAAAPGPRVVCADDPGAMALAAVLHEPDAAGASPPSSPMNGPAGPIVTYGTNPTATVRIEDVALGAAGAAFALRSRAGRRLTTVWLRVPGLHNVRNATAALTMAEALGVPWATGAAALRGYRGVARRFERRGERDGITFIDDYGHLPGEVASALAAAAGRWDRVVAVFQPHRYSRTEALWQDFANAFRGADVVLVTDIYPAGELPRPGVTGQLIADAVRSAQPNRDVHYAPTLDDAAAELRRILQPGDLCLTLGAGDLTTLPERFLEPPDGPSGSGGG